MARFYTGRGDEGKIVQRLLSGGFTEEAEKFKNFTPEQEGSFSRVVCKAYFTDPDEDFIKNYTQDFSSYELLLSFNARTMASIIRKA